jgi:hypothetical protein|tara:strand:+ start:932 stop:1213 length:282 start_codon:yes stop_codon:yes gene_type:complete
MAKRKTPKVKDLRPTSINDEQLKSIQEIVSNMNKIHIETGRIESQKHALLHGLVDHQNKLNELQKELQEEYGTVNVNINTGEINYDVEADKED